MLGVDSTGHNSVLPSNSIKRKGPEIEAPPVKISRNKGSLGAITPPMPLTYTGSLHRDKYEIAESIAVEDPRIPPMLTRPIASQVITTATPIPRTASDPIDFEMTLTWGQLMYATHSAATINISKSILLSAWEIATGLNHEAPLLATLARVLNAGGKVFLSTENGWQEVHSIREFHTAKDLICEANQDRFQLELDRFNLSRSDVVHLDQVQLLTLQSEMGLRPNGKTDFLSVDSEMPRYMWRWSEAMLEGSTTFLRPSNAHYLQLDSLDDASAIASLLRRYPHARYFDFSESKVPRNADFFRLLIDNLVSQGGIIEGLVLPRDFSLDHHCEDMLKHLFSECSLLEFEANNIHIKDQSTGYCLFNGLQFARSLTFIDGSGVTSYLLETPFHALTHLYLHNAVSDTNIILTHLKERRLPLA